MTLLSYGFSFIFDTLHQFPFKSKQLTGGKLNHTTTIRFTTEDGTNSELLIVQRFNGLNVWDQLAVDIEVNGNLPQIRPNAELYFSDTTDSYVFQQENKIQSGGSGIILVDGHNITYTVNQLVCQIVVDFIWFFAIYFIDLIGNKMFPLQQLFRN